MTADIGPAAQGAYRVPRSYVDENYIRGEALPSSRTGIGVVVSIDGETVTVLIGGDLVPGVVYLGQVPKVGDVVEVAARGDLLVIPATADLDAFTRGLEDDAEHIVSDTDPGKPQPQEVNVGGSMRD